MTCWTIWTQFHDFFKDKHVLPAGRRPRDLTIWPRCSPGPLPSSDPDPPEMSNGCPAFSTVSENPLKLFQIFSPTEHGDSRSFVGIAHSQVQVFITNTWSLSGGESRTPSLSLLCIYHKHTRTKNSLVDTQTHIAQATNFGRYCHTVPSVFLIIYRLSKHIAQATN